MAAKELPPFAPPSQKSIDETLRPEDAEAADLAGKLLAAKGPNPIGFTVNHEGVGPWTKGQRLAVKEIVSHLSGRDHRITDEREIELAVNRLVELNALVPFFE